MKKLPNSESAKANGCNAYLLKSILSACFVIAASVVSGQNYFDLTFGNPGTQYERFNSGTYFGGDLIAAGYATTPSGSYIVRINSTTGQYVWQSRLGDATVVNSIQNTSDGNLILGGKKLNGSNSNKFALIKINGNGGWLWTKTFGGPFQYQAEKAIQTSDGGFALFGTSQLDLQNQSSSGRLYLLKTNANGDSTWAKTYGVPAGWQRGYDVIELSGGGYAVCGESYNSVSSAGGSIVIRTNASGDTLWTRVFGTSYDAAKRIIEHGGFLYILNQNSFGPQVNIVKIDLAGNFISTTSNIGSSVATGGFVRNPGGSFSVAVSDYNSDNVKIYNTNTSGANQLIRTFNGAYQLNAGNIIETWTSQLAVFGRDYDYQVGVEDGWVASLDTLGNVQQIQNCSVEIGVEDTVVCQGAYIPNPVVSGTGPFTYYWTPPIGMSNPNIANPVIQDVYNQNYTLIVTDANNCTSVDNVTVTSYTASSDSVFLCNNGSATLDLGSGSQNYLWQTWTDTSGVTHSLGNTTQTLTVTEPGTYLAIEYTQGCGVLTSQFFVGYCEDACDNAWNIFTYQNDPFCFGDSMLLVGTGGNQIVSWNWSAPGWGNFGNQPTTYMVFTGSNLQPVQVTLTTIDINGCTAVSSLTVVPQSGDLSVYAGPDTVICNGTYSLTPQVTGGTGPYTYLWEPQSFFSNPNLATQSFSNIYNQTFWVWATDATGCTSLDTINLTVLANTNQLHDTIYLCNSTAYLELAPGAYYYSWQNGQSTQGIVVNQTGNYLGYGTYPGNCGPVIVNFHVLPCNTNCNNIFTYQHNPWACGDSVLFVGSGSGNIVNWTWDFGDGNIQSNSFPTVYHYYAPQNGVTYVVTLTTTDDNGCIYTSTNQVLIQGGQGLSVHAGGDQVYCNAGSYQLNGVATGGTSPYSYQWSPSTGLSNPAIADPIAVVQGPVSYILTVFDANGCYGVDTINLDIIHAINDTVYLCNGTAELCLQNNSFNYIWNPGGAQTQCITVSDTGTYFGVSWPEGCQTTPNYFHVLPCTTSCWNAFTHVNNPWACGDSVLFVATTSFACNQFTWDFGDGTTINSTNPNIYHYYGAGTYVVTLTTVDANNCTSVSTITVVISDGFAVDAGNDTIVCQGDAQLHATPSVPGNYFYQWSPSTGLNNPYIQNPVASHVHQQVYTVTVTDVASGCTAIDSVMVSAYNWSVDTVELCGGNVTLDFGPGAVQYYWQSYTDQQGNNVPLNQNTQTLTTSNPGTYFGYVWFQNCGTLTSIFYVVPCQSDSVWPGDANADGQAHNMDMLTIGIGYGTNGLVRPNATINWNPEASAAWGLQLQSGVDYKHIDCNGDGTINVDDTLAVIQNYGLLHSLLGEETSTGADDPMLSLSVASDTVLTGNSVTVQVNLGTQSVPANDVYGIAFTVNYNEELLATNSMGVSFGNSWFGNHGLNTISLRKNIHGLGRMDVALTRIDHQNISGYGTIGELHFITIDNLSGKQTLYETLQLELSDVRLIRNDESEVVLGIQNDSVVVTDLGSAINELNTLEAGTSIYPNPARELLTVSLPAGLQGMNYELTILNAAGQAVQVSNTGAGISTVDVSRFAEGIYFLRISDGKVVVNKKFTVIR